MTTGILFPHQLFEQNILTSKCNTIYLIEEDLYFKQFKFHKQKIAFHRASMKFYENYLKLKNIKVVYIDSSQRIADIRKLIPFLKAMGVNSIEYLDTTDYWLESRINQSCMTHHVEIIKNPTQLFLNSTQEITAYFSDKKRMFQTDFYKYQRIRRNIFVEKNLNPKGGKWTFDSENRLKYPKGKIPPTVDLLKVNSFYSEATTYTEKIFYTNYGKLNFDFIYPTTFTESKNWLHTFLKSRFSEFGDFEDAILSKENVLHHSVLTPMLNVGLLTPQFVIDEALTYAEVQQIPLNSVEGFIRQILGWREFIRAVYELKGRDQRIKNYWGFTRKIPPLILEWNHRNRAD